jgi:transposase-like protein
MTDSGLSTQQLAVICALSSGATSTDAAAQAGVHRNTIANWRRNLLPFQYALANAQYDRALFFREKMEDQADAAIQTIQQILTDPKAPASVRLRAALAVMATASTPPEPKKRTELDLEKIVHPRTEPEVITPEQISDAQLGVVPNQPKVHNSAQAPYRRETPKVGRNEPCPCGSGQKYKRCCLGKPLSTEAPSGLRDSDILRCGEGIA